MADEKIAVYFCHCGSNIAGKVDVEKVICLGCRAAQRGGLARVQVHVLGSRPGPDQRGHPEARREPRGRGGLLADDARAHVPQGGGRRGPQSLPPPDGQRARALLLGHRGQGRGHREGQAHPERADPPPAVQPAARPHRGAGQPGRHGRRRRHRRHRGRAQALGHGQEGLPRREEAEHRRSHGDVRQDVPDARLCGLHPHAEDVGGRQGPQHHHARLQRGRGGRRVRRQLQGQGP